MTIIMTIIRFKLQEIRHLPLLIAICSENAEVKVNSVSCLKKVDYDDVNYYLVINSSANPDYYF